MGSGSVWFHRQGDSKNRTQQETVVLDAGFAVFPYLGVGHRYKLGLNLDRPSILQAEVGGLQHHGDVSQHTFDLRTVPMISALLVDPDDQPMGGLKIEVDLDLGGATVHESLICDAEGRLVFRLRPEHVGTRLKRVAMTTGSMNAIAGKAIVELVLDQALTSKLELGRLVLADEALLVSGRVIDDARGSVSIMSIQVVDPAARAKTLDLPVRLLGEGRFEIRGSYNGHDLVILVISDIDSETLVKTGQTDVEIVHQRTGSIRLYCGQTGSQGLGVQFKLFPTAGGVPVLGQRYVNRKLEDKACFSWRDLPVGQYRLEGKLLSEPGAFCSLENITIAQGDNFDPRLESVDLGEAASLELTLTDAQGQPIDEQLSGIVFVRSSSAPTNWEGVRVQSKGFRPVLTLRSGSQDLRVCISGYQPVSLKGVEARAVVHLIPRNQVAFVVEVDGSSDFEGRVGVRAIRVGTKSEAFTIEGMSSVLLSQDGFSSFVFIRPNVLARLMLPGPGEYEIQLIRGRESLPILDAILATEKSDSGGMIAEHSPRRFVMSETSRTSPLRIRVPAAQLR